LGGALRCLADSESPSPKKKPQNTRQSAQKLQSRAKLMSLHWCFALVLFATTSALQNPAAPIWPQPLSASYGEGTLHASPTRLLLAGQAPGPVLRRALSRCERALFGNSVSTTANSTAPVLSVFRMVVESLDEELAGPKDESYTLNVSKMGIFITAKTVWGARYALDSLTQLQLTRSDRTAGASFRHATVFDQPQYSYRGLMLSPGQRFITPALLKTFLDGMEIARLNVLHFHLSEFCRYAIESKAFPSLAANLSTGLNSGFYTFEDINTLVAQAKARGIRIIPEYDVPGHQARNMGVIDEIKWCGSRPPVSGNYQWEIFDDPDGASFGVISKLYRELIGLFPDQYFHVGGDEVAKVGPCSGEWVHSVSIDPDPYVY
jgi:hexosaminidase